MNVDDVTNCEVCGRHDREDRMLLCDGCDKGFHCECLRPRIHEIPEGLWFCDACKRIQKIVKRENRKIQAVDFYSGEEDEEEKEDDEEIDEKEDEMTTQPTTSRATSVKSSKAKKSSKSKKRLAIKLKLTLKKIAQSLC